MGPELKEKIVAALKAACLPDDETPDIRLEATSDSHVGGVVLSKAFEDLDPAQRQDRIWQRLDAALSPYERTLISFLLTQTPDEYEVVRQYPTLDKVDPSGFARAVEYRTGALANRGDAKELARKAEALARYAIKGEGPSDAEGWTLAEEIAVAIGYAPLSQAAEDGYGIVLIGAQGRARLKEGKPVTAKELHVLATLVRGSREPITPKADGTVSNADAIEYLKRRGIRL
jgi:hypothetical protein